MAEQPCPFCDISRDPCNPRLLAANDYAFVIADGFPVTDGHTLIISKRHVGLLNSYQYWKERNEDTAALDSIQDIAAQSLSDQSDSFKVLGEFVAVI
ncbi:hypothetical protein R50073_16390 [Maricurvus nonylphenolicus]|uniref:HIT family protein n=1 Tax=Maricurvus nonylphenolicus TaxID=1008307 RepID=UPI0036F2DCCA